MSGASVRAWTDLGIGVERGEWAGRYVPKITIEGTAMRMIAVLATLSAFMAPCGAFAAQAAPQGGTTPPGAAAAPSVAASRDAPATGNSMAPAGGVQTGPGKAAAPSVAAVRGKRGHRSHSTAPKTVAGPGAGGAPSVAAQGPK